MRTEIYIGIKNSHKWTRYAALSLALAVVPFAGAVAASASPSNAVGAVVVAASSSPTASTVSPDSSKWT